MQIKTTGKNRYAATFNRRSLRIDATGELKAVDTSTGEIIDGTELASIKRLVAWHVKTKRDHNELKTFWTTR